MADPCKKEEILAEMRVEHKRLEDRMHNSDLRFQQIQDSMGSIAGDITEMKVDVSQIQRRLFVNNGNPSIQTMLDRHQQVINGLIWTVALVVTAVVPTSIWAIIKTVSHVGGG